MKSVLDSRWNEIQLLHYCYYCVVDDDCCSTWTTVRLPELYSYTLALLLTVCSSMGKPVCTHMHTVEPPIMGPLRKGHCMLDLSIKDTAWGPKNYSPYSSNTLRTSKKRTTSPWRTKQLNLYCPQIVLYSEVPLYSHTHTHTRTHTHTVCMSPCSCSLHHPVLAVFCAHIWVCIKTVD